jgi:ribosome-associated protein
MSEKPKKPLAGRRLVNEVVAAAQEKLAEEIAVLNLRRASADADYFIVCQGETTVQNRAIAEAIADRCAGKNTRPWHTEGEDEGRWILIDFTDVVVHILLPDLRAFYSLESLWSDAKRIDLGEKSETRNPKSET